MPFAASRIAQALRIARASPSKAAKKPSPRGIDLAAAEIRDLASRQTVIPFQQVPPARLVSQSGMNTRSSGPSPIA
jgi:hypothetical protein